MKIIVKTIKGINIILNVNPTDSIDIIKDKIEYQEGTPSYGQCLIFSGKQLQKNNTLEDYNIEDNSIIRLVMRFNGS